MRGVCEGEIIKCVSLPTEEQTHSSHGSLPRCLRCPCRRLPLYWTTLTFKYSGKVSVTASAGLVGTRACMHTCSYVHVWNDKGPRVRSRSAVSRCQAFIGDSGSFAEAIVLLANGWKTINMAKWSCALKTELYFPVSSCGKTQVSKTSGQSIRHFPMSPRWISNRRQPWSVCVAKK